MSKRIVLTTFGSYGDLHPYLAIATELKRRGHHPVLATIPIYQAKVEAAGFEFALLRTTLIDLPDRGLMDKIMHLRNGAEFIVRKLVMPAIRTAYEDTLKAADGADLLVSHPLTLPTGLVAERLGLPWASTQLAPMGFFSPYDPPAVPGAPLFSALRPLGTAFFGPLFRLAKMSVRRWTAPYAELRAELGAPPIRNPMFEGSYSPSLVLGLFSELLGPQQPDWPAQAVSTGFPFYDHDGEAGLSPELERFLEAGDPPLVFTLGTSAVLTPGQFYGESAKAAHLLGRRAVLLTGRDLGNQPAKVPEGVICCGYAPFSKLFSRAAAIVHQGGVGTTGQAMRAGRPMLVVPWAVDQPDNAARVERLGIARLLSRKAYRADRAAREIDRLLSEPRYRDTAALVGSRVSLERGAEVACDCLERLL